MFPINLQVFLSVTFSFIISVNINYLIFVIMYFLGTPLIFSFFSFPFTFKSIFSIYLHVCIFLVIQVSCRLIILLIFIFLLLLLNFYSCNDTLLLYIISLFPFVVLSLILHYIFMDSISGHINFFESIYKIETIANIY